LPADFYKEIVKKFPFQLTIKQRALFRLLSDFIFDEDKSTVFILKGYAGTGKTTTISTLVNSLWKAKKKSGFIGPNRKSSQSDCCVFKKTSIYHSQKNLFP